LLGGGGTARVKRRRLTVFRLSFDPNAIATALKVEPDELIADMKDGRVASRFAERWGARLYDFAKAASSNFRGSDGMRDLGRIGSLKIEVKCLTAGGVRLQPSRFIGVGRPTATRDDLVRAFRENDRYLVVDITAFPTVDMYLLEASWLITLAMQDPPRLSAHPLRRSALRALLEAEFDLVQEPVSL
jgi:hypothetical protein